MNTCEIADKATPTPDIITENRDKTIRFRETHTPTIWDELVFEVLVPGGNHDDVDAWVPIARIIYIWSVGQKKPYGAELLMHDPTSETPTVYIHSLQESGRIEPVHRPFELTHGTLPLDWVRRYAYPGTNNEEQIDFGKTVAAFEKQRDERNFSPPNLLR